VPCFQASAPRGHTCPYLRLAPPCECRPISRNFNRGPGEYGFSRTYCRLPGSPWGPPATMGYRPRRKSISDIRTMPLGACRGMLWGSQVPFSASRSASARLDLLVLAPPCFLQELNGLSDRGATIVRGWEAAQFLPHFVLFARSVHASIPSRPLSRRIPIHFGQPCRVPHVSVARNLQIKVPVNVTFGCILAPN